MHIEPGMVASAKIGLSYVTAAGAIGFGLKASYESIKENRLISFLIKSVIATVLVFTFFEVLPHQPVGVSEVHLIMGTTIFLLFGLAPSMVGLSMGLLIQGVFFAPFDLPQYGMNVTTILVPLIAMSYIAKRIIAPNTAYKDIGYSQALKLSTAYQAGIVSWVGFWALYGQGTAIFGEIATFGAAYMSVILVEPLLDLAVLAFAKKLSRLENTPFVEKRLYCREEV